MYGFQIECVNEDEDLKKSVFRKLDQVINCVWGVGLDVRPGHVVCRRVEIHVMARFDGQASYMPAHTEGV
jgi:hypothetical protein